MTIIYYPQAQVDILRDNVERRIGNTNQMMMAIIDFYDGPKSQPDPLHSHPHEQITYVAEGEILFILQNDTYHLKPGDMFLVESSKPHTIQQLTEHVRLVDCFTPIREDFLAQRNKQGG